jgi:hypothetical protein
MTRNIWTAKNLTVPESLAILMWKISRTEIPAISLSGLSDVAGGRVTRMCRFAGNFRLWENAPDKSNGNSIFKHNTSDCRGTEEHGNVIASNTSEGVAVQQTLLL